MFLFSLRMGAALAVKKWATDDMDQTTFDRRFGRRPREKIDVPRLVGRALHRRYVHPFTSWRNIWRAIVSFFPIVGWLPKYSLKGDLIRDIIGGTIVGIMHIPQGIAYSSLAGVPAVVGLYTSFFPPLLYMLFGSSRHVSVGSFAVVALMAGNAVQKFSCVKGELASSSTSSINCSSLQLEYSPLEVASTLTFIIGLVQFLMGSMALSFMTAYFSDGLVAGFTTGAAMHVMTTQLKDILGIYNDSRRTEWGQLPMKILDLLTRIPDTNWVTVALSTVVFTILLLGKYLVNPFVQKRLKSPIPVPFELLVVIAGTLVSHFLDLEKNHNVSSVGDIPTGMPAPSLPKFSLFTRLLPDAVSIAVVVLAIQVSLTKMFAKKYKYPVDVSQEFYGTGLMCIFSGFFPVYPPSPSLSRTMVNGSAGTRTQLSAIVSSALILTLCLFAGKYLHALPMCILAVIVVVALFGMFTQLTQLPHLWRVSKIDFFIWLISFAGTVALDVVAGLVLALGFALFTTVLRSQCANLSLLTEAADGVYCDIDRYSAVEVIEGVRVIRFNAPLIFTNAENFQKLVSAAVDEQQEEDVQESESDTSKLVSESEKDTGLVIDCSPFIYCDVMGMEIIKDLYEEMKEKHVRLLFAAAPDAMRDLMEDCDKENKIPSSAFYPTVSGAITKLTGRY